MIGEKWDVTLIEKLKDPKLSFIAHGAILSRNIDVFLWCKSKGYSPTPDIKDYMIKHDLACYL